MNLGTFGPGIKIGCGGDLLFCVLFLKAKVTLTMNRAILLSRTTIMAICESMPAFFSPRILGFARIPKSSLVDELVLSEAERRVLSF